MFEIVEDNKTKDENNRNIDDFNKSQGDSNDSIVNVAEQMDIFDFLSEEDEQEAPTGIVITIPEDVISPLECTKGLRTKEFRNVQLRWKKYVDALYEQEGGSWIEVREKLVGAFLGKQ